MPDESIANKEITCAVATKVKNDATALDEIFDLVVNRISPLKNILDMARAGCADAHTAEMIDIACEEADSVISTLSRLRVLRSSFGSAHGSGTLEIEAVVPE